jgi:hypothetical protein
MAGLVPFARATQHASRAWRRSKKISGPDLDRLYINTIQRAKTLRQEHVTFGKQNIFNTLGIKYLTPVNCLEYVTKPVRAP